LGGGSACSAAIKALFDGVIPKGRVLTSGPRDLRWHSAGEQEIPPLCLKNGYARDDASTVAHFKLRHYQSSSLLDLAFSFLYLY
jgi:hypothetical protein